MSLIKDILDGLETLRMEGYSDFPEVGATPELFQKLVFEVLDNPDRIPLTLEVLGQPVAYLPSPGGEEFVVISGREVGGKRRKFFFLPPGQPAYETIVDETTQ